MKENLSLPISSATSSSLSSERLINTILTPFLANYDLKQKKQKTSSYFHFYYTKHCSLKYSWKISFEKFNYLFPFVFIYKNTVLILNIKIAKVFIFSLINWYVMTKTLLKLRKFCYYNEVVKLQQLHYLFRIGFSDTICCTCDN